MSLQLSWSIDGSKELSRVLNGIGEGIKDWRPAFKEAGDTLADIFSDDVFTSEGGVIGERWPALKPAYLAQKVKAGYPADTLIRTGKMKRSFKNTFSATSAEVTNSTAYFKYHQSNKARSSNLPRRVMMKLGENQKQLVVKVFHTYWYKVVNKR